MWYAIAALISIVWGVVLLYGALAVHDVPAVSTLTYALFLVVMLSNMGTWLCATARRTDLRTRSRELGTASRSWSASGRDRQRDPSC
jgi:hypothetical protein